MSNKINIDVINDFSESYKKFISNAKTEREAVSFCEQELVKSNYINLDSQEDDIKKEIRVNNRKQVYKKVRNKGLMAARIGDPEEGFTIIVAHADSPRLALKPIPLFYKNGIAYGKTFYRGGIKPYQWVNIPLALHGIAKTKDGNVIQLCLGEKDNEPSFLIPDSSLHLSGDQLSKPAKEAVRAEDLNALLSGMPLSVEWDKESLDEKTSDLVKENLIIHLKTEYGITENELCAAELHLVPRGKALDIGFDRIFVGAFGQDDRICVYCALRAFLEANQESKKTLVLFCVDREEIGSIGNTAARSEIYETFLLELYSMINNDNNDLYFRKIKEKSTVFSADVTPVMGLMDKNNTDPQNTGKPGKGICLDKHMSSSNFEYVQNIVDLLSAHGIDWQFSVAGKEKVQFGGSVAYSFSHRGMEVINAGPGLLCTHAPMELVHKRDLFMTYRAYETFYSKG